MPHSLRHQQTEYSRTVLVHSFGPTTGDTVDIFGGAANTFFNWWDKIIVALTGRRIAVLGARAVGKTHLMTFLTTGSLPVEYKQTVASQKTDGNRFKLEDLELRVKSGLDVSGDKAAYGAWKSLFFNADIVLYLLRADLLIQQEASTEARVRDDFRHIESWLLERSNPPKFFIIGTHCDLDENYRTTNDSRRGDFYDSFNRLPIVSELVARAGGRAKTNIVLGSMKTDGHAEKLVKGLLEQVAL